MIAVTRPIGSPYIPAIGVTSLSADGIWTRGAAAQVKDTPPGIVGPVRALRRCRRSRTSPPTNSNGTDVAVGADGSLHVVWTAPDGVWYAKGPDGFTARAALRLRLLAEAGRADRQPLRRGRRRRDPMGRVYTTNSSGQEVRVATLDGDKWTTDTVVSIPTVRRMSAARPDEDRRHARRAGRGLRRHRERMRSTSRRSRDGDVDRRDRRRHERARARALDLAVDADGNPIVSRTTRADNLEVTLGRDGELTADRRSPRRPTASPTPRAGTSRPTAGSPSTTAGTIYVTWDARRRRRVRLGRRLDLHADRDRDRRPATAPTRRVATNADGSAVYVAWYDTVTKALMMGVQGDPGDIGSPQPSPAPLARFAAIHRRRGVRAPTGRSRSTSRRRTSRSTRPAWWRPPASRSRSTSTTRTTRPRPARTTSRSATDSGYTDFLFTGDLITGPDQVEYNGRRARCREVLLPLRRPPDDDGAGRRRRGRAARSSDDFTGCHPPRS